jgi:hypothetical protein
MEGLYWPRSAPLASILRPVPPVSLGAWESFYVIVGSSGAALIGLQFVVLVLAAELEIGPTHRQIAAFTTPTIVHFVVALFISAVMSAPWPSTIGPSVVLAITGAVGVLYSAINVRRTLREHDYEPVWQDWLWYAVLPLAAYVALLVAALLAHSLFLIGATALGFLLIGIHNAWDTVKYIAIDRVKAKSSASER